jgi:hypothetical protein
LCAYCREVLLTFTGFPCSENQTVTHCQDVKFTALVCITGITGITGM